ncbi:MAG: hypothetical protein [Siphoviridae sp. ctdc_1]|nr:MAG: hypothetical protein [Siphoviridae sp. ctdc_1]
MIEFQYEELICAILKIPDEKRDDDFDIYDVCEEHLGVSFDDFCAIGQTLLKCTPGAVSPLSGKAYHAFIVDGIAHVKTEFTQGGDHA